MSPLELASTRRPRSLGKRPWVRASAYLAPALILYAAFLIYPMIESVRLAFFKWSGYATEPQEFVGMRNFVRLFTVDTVFWTAFRNSLIWVVLSLAVPMVISLLIALALNRKVMGRNVFRSVFYLPAVFASITVAAMWRWIYAPSIGAVDQALTLLGLDSWSHEWLGDPNLALYSIFVAAIWQGIGFNMVLFLAGLQQVPAELVEAAQIDGANTWQRFWAVTMPALRPTTVVVVILTIINSLKVFDLIVGMTGGGPAQSTQVLALWSYTQSFSNHNFGMGGATATVLLVISLALVIPYLAWSMKGND
ncbi:MAG TPA: sugar ABC transporter permease [Propionicimonas sp.]|nr:sugar ABC transporter permease [Propionicimonas sp.]HRA06357.1 sugar ABC transporter permease [Propionicimonas sp.]